MLPVILVAVGAYLIGDSVLGDKKYAKGGMSDGGEKAAKKRLEQLRKALRAERISYGELAELESLKEYIDENDIELKQAAGIPEFEDEDEYAKGGNVEGKAGSKFKIEMWNSFDDMAYEKKKPSRIVYSDSENELRELGEDNRSSKLYMKRKGKYMNITTFLEKGGKLVGKQKNLDVNKNGKLDAEDFKMLRKGKGGKFPKGSLVKTKITMLPKHIGGSLKVVKGSIGVVFRAPVSDDDDMVGVKFENGAKGYYEQVDLIAVDKK